MDTIRLSKVCYSELVVRKALYWWSEHSDWELDFDEESWIITFSTNNNISESKPHFYRILNDFVLREKLDEQTQHLRLKIVKSALDAI